MIKLKPISPRGQIKNLSLAIGQSCFLHCPGCCNHFSSGLISKKDILYFVKLIRDEYGLEKVTICGGDPLSRPDILNVLKGIKSFGLKINLDTTGVPLLGDGSVKKIPLRLVVKYVDLLGLPIDGPNNIITNKFRKGRLNYFNEVIGLIHGLEKYNLSICINTVVHKDNVDLLEAIADKIHGLPGVVRWQLFQFDPSGPGGYANRHKYYISDQDFSDATKRLSEYVLTKKLKIILDYKSIASRKNAYILVDSDGNVWAPTINSGKWSIDDKNNSERIVFGNIRDRDNIKNIIELSLKYKKTN